MMKAKDEEIQSLRKEIKPSLLNRSLPDDVESSSEERIVQKLESDVTLLRKQVSLILKFKQKKRLVPKGVSFECKFGRQRTYT